MKLKEPLPLERRISDIRAESAAFVKAYVQEHNVSGLPGVVFERMLYSKAGGDPCEAAIQVIATTKRDDEIAARQSA